MNAKHRFTAYVYGLRLASALTLSWGMLISVVPLMDLVKVAILAALLAITAVLFTVVYRLTDHTPTPFSDNVASPDNPSDVALKEAFIICGLAFPILLLAFSFLR